MYCPNCGQQQISDQTRFCSRCGFLLNLVNEILANGGVLPQLEQLKPKKRRFFTKRNGMVFSLLWFIFFIFMTAFAAVVSNGDENVTPVFALIAFFGSILIMLFSAFFLPSANEVQYSSHAEMQNQIPTNLNQNALPPQQTIPVSNFVQPQAGMWKETNELIEVDNSEKATKILTDEIK